MVTFADKGQQPVVQVADEVTLTAEYGDPVIRVILDKPFVQVMPVGWQVYLGVLSGFLLHNLAYGTGAEQFRHTVQPPVLLCLVDKAHGDIRLYLQENLHEAAFPVLYGKGPVHGDGIQADKHGGMVCLQQNPSQYILVCHAQAGNLFHIVSALYRQRVQFFRKVEMDICPLRFQHAVLQIVQQVGQP